MGDLIGKSLSGTLSYVPKSAFDALRDAPIDALDRVRVFADLSRINTLYMIARAGSGHIGSSFSSLEIVSLLHLKQLARPKADSLYFSSKGHDAPGLYAVKAALGHLPFESIHSLRRLGGLPGHPDVGTAGVVANTGSLGMGISKAKGMVRARRRHGKRAPIYVMTGDGELQEGQIWESLASAVNDRLGEIVVIVDHNKLQSDTFVSATSDLGDIEGKFRAFGWKVDRVDGHDVAALDRALDFAASLDSKPKVIVADTVKGKGVSFMEHLALDSDTQVYRFHSGAPDQENYERAFAELAIRVVENWRRLGLADFEFASVDVPSVAPTTGKLQRLTSAYSAALVEQVQRRNDILVLDADLVVDTGQGPVKAAFPQRFVECGIAEMDMVSQAGGMALMGALPICHSFACFLSTRPNEHIYNNATERTRIVYVASLAGLLPAGPGHSHQSVRDISALAAIPGLDMLSPCCEAEVAPALDYCVNGAPASSYLRLESVPCDVPFELPNDYVLRRGRGIKLSSGDDAILFGYGPVLLSEAFKAGERLRTQGVCIEIINLPWLNVVDAEWLASALLGHQRVITLDNHYTRGGQGEMLLATIAELGLSSRLDVLRLGVECIPACGRNDEVLAVHGLDSDSLQRRIHSFVVQDAETRGSNGRSTTYDAVRLE